MNTPIRMGPIQSDTIVFTTTTAIIISGALYHPRSTQSLLKLRDPGGERGSRLLPRASPSVLSISIQPLASSICRTLAAHDSERLDSSPSRASASLARLSQVSAISNRYFFAMPTALAASFRHRSACRRYSDTSSTFRFHPCYFGEPLSPRAD
jgi:hypothetical protein